MSLEGYSLWGHKELDMTEVIASIHPFWHHQELSVLAQHYEILGWGAIFHTTGCLAESPTPLTRCHPKSRQLEVSPDIAKCPPGYKITLVENQCCKCSNGNPEFAPYRLVTIELECHFHQQ